MVQDPVSSVIVVGVVIVIAYFVHKMRVSGLETEVNNAKAEKADLERRIESARQEIDQYEVYDRDDKGKFVEIDRIEALRE